MEFLFGFKPFSLRTSWRASLTVSWWAFLKTSCRTLLKKTSRKIFFLKIPWRTTSLSSFMSFLGNFLEEFMKYILEDILEAFWSKTFWRIFPRNSWRFIALTILEELSGGLPGKVSTLSWDIWQSPWRTWFQLISDFLKNFLERTFLRISWRASRSIRNSFRTLPKTFWRASRRLLTQYEACYT